MRFQRNAATLIANFIDRAKERLVNRMSDPITEDTTLHEGDRTETRTTRREALNETLRRLETTVLSAGVALGL